MFLSGQLDSQAQDTANIRECVTELLQAHGIKSTHETPAGRVSQRKNCKKCKQSYRKQKQTARTSNATQLANASPPLRFASADDDLILASLANHLYSNCIIET